MILTCLAQFRPSCRTSTSDAFSLLFEELFAYFPIRAHTPE